MEIAMTDVDPSPLRLPWSRSDRAFPRTVVRPLQEFLRSSTASALPLFCAAVVALAWANSPWWRSYERLWATTLTVGVGRWAINEDLRFWVGEGLMTFFFLLAGLEIKRELVTGELRDRRAAIVPVAAAVGGMVVPAVLYLVATRGTPAADGWGMAMPTDLAFALAILVIAMRSAPPGIRPFLLTLAIADDLLTVVVVAVFYAGSVSWLPLGLASLSVAAMIACERARVRHLLVYLVLGALTWLFAYHAGVHPALVGAVLGLLAPALPFQRPADVSAAAHRIADETSDHPDPPDEDAVSWLELARLSHEAVSPLARIEHELLPWVNLAALPLFALANAGVRLSGGWWSPTTARLVVGLIVARLAGKVAGIVGACWLVARLRLGRIPGPDGLGAPAAAAAAAGAPFTVSLFVASSVFPEGSSLLAAARLGILLSIVVSGVGALVITRAGRVRPARSARAR
jgi:Na+:H+ antiporter, NhaA family